MRKFNLLDSTTKNFLAYLASLGVAENSLVNYKSDIAHFTQWLIFRVRSWGVLADDLSETVPLLNQNIAFEYKNFMLVNNIASKTVNRRLSTLRHLGRFLLENQILDFDFTDGLQNTSTGQTTGIYPFIKEFEGHLRKTNVSNNTIKNYLSDIRHFISWLEQRNG